MKHAASPRPRAPLVPRRTDSRGIPYAASLLARLRTCIAADIPAPRELLVQVVAAMEGEVGARAQLCKRDKLIRRAGMLTGATSRHARAAELVAHVRALPRHRLRMPEGVPRPPAATVRECLLEAASYGRLPDSHRQLLRILECPPRGD